MKYRVIVEIVTAHEVEVEADSHQQAVTAVEDMDVSEIEDHPYLYEELNAISSIDETGGEVICPPVFQ